MLNQCNLPWNICCQDPLSKQIPKDDFVLSPPEGANASVSSSPGPGHLI